MVELRNETERGNGTAVEDRGTQTRQISGRNVVSIGTQTDVNPITLVDVAVQTIECNLTPSLLR